MINELLQNTEKLYTLALSLDNASHSIKDNPYHRQFAHPMMAYSFITSSCLLPNQNIKAVLQVAALIHDIANLFSDYQDHEITLVSLLCKYDPGISSFTNEIRSLFGSSEPTVRSIADKRIQQKASLFIEDLSRDPIFRDIRYWDLVKLCILATIPSHLKPVFEANKELVDSLIKNIHEKSLSLKQDQELYSQLHVPDKEIEDPANYYLFSDSLSKLIKRFSKIYNFDLKTTYQSAFILRISDFASFFDISDYDSIIDDIAIFLSKTTNDTSLRNTSMNFVNSEEDFKFYTHHLRLSLNLYILTNHLYLNGLILIKEGTISNMESVIFELITRSWGNHT